MSHGHTTTNYFRLGWGANSAFQTAAHRRITVFDSSDRGGAEVIGKESPPECARQVKGKRHHVAGRGRETCIVRLRTAGTLPDEGCVVGLRERRMDGRIPALETTRDCTHSIVSQ